MLNVALKGKEVVLVELNSRTPLLRLPGEIRNRIWGYALGNEVIQVTPSISRANEHCFKFLDRPVAIAPLRASRQIYHETALLPFRLNTFLLLRPIDVSQLERQLTPRQRALVRFIRFEGTIPFLPEHAYSELANGLQRVGLSGLERVEIRILMFDDGYADLATTVRAHIMHTFQMHLPHARCVVTTWTRVSNAAVNWRLIDV